VSGDRSPGDSLATHVGSRYSYNATTLTIYCAGRIATNFARHANCSADIRRWYILRAYRLARSLLSLIDCMLHTADNSVSNTHTTYGEFWILLQVAKLTPDHVLERSTTTRQAACFAATTHPSDTIICPNHVLKYRPMRRYVYFSSSQTHFLFENLEIPVLSSHGCRWQWSHHLGNSL
jgi:hypothetical protein